MFCGKCGTQLPDGASFCSKCGNRMNGNVGNKTTENKMTGNKPTMSMPSINKQAVSETVQKIVSEEKIEQLKTAAKNISFSDKRVQIGAAVAGGLIVLLLIVIIIGSSSSKNSNSYVADDTSNNASNTEQGSGMSDEIKNTKNLKEAGDMMLQGELPKLESIELEDGRLFLEPGAVYPKVTSIQCRSIVTKNYNDNVFSFETTAFPALQRVKISAKNSQIDRDALKTIETLILMKDGGMLSNVELDITHTIEDLYGNWTEENGKLAFTLAEDGTVQLSAGSEFFDFGVGVNLFNFEEVDNDTLKFTASVGTMRLKLGMNADYMLLGDKLTITLAGNEFVLYRNGSGSMLSESEDTQGVNVPEESSAEAEDNTATKRKKRLEYDLLEIRIINKKTETTKKGENHVL